MDIEHSASAHPAMEQDQARSGTACVVQRILYCHGFASNFDPEKEKVRALLTLAPVDGVTVDYTSPPSQVFAAFSGAIVAQKNTLIVGTSMGGFFAAWLGCELGLPFIAINPAITPANALRKYIGVGRTHYGTTFDLKQEVTDAYSGLPFRVDGDGTVALDLEDEVIDAYATITAIKNRLPLITFQGGSHRFDHLHALLPEIKRRFLAS